MAIYNNGFWEGFKNIFKELKRYTEDTTKALQQGDSRQVNPETGSSYGLIDQATGYMNSAEAAKDRVFNAAEAEKQRQWETEMSNTAYQRATADMQAAGINPILAYAQGGAATPPAAAANANTNAGSNAGQMMQFAGNMINTAKTLKQNAEIAKQANATKAYIANLQQQTQIEKAKIYAAAKKSNSANTFKRHVKPQNERQYSDKEYNNMIDKLEDIVL